MKYSAPIDGMRAIAIVVVLVFHIYPNALKGGFIGVDVFFVLSGYLITSIILSGIQKGSFSLKEFYLRRVQRLLPNIISMLLAVLTIFLFLMPYFQAMQMAQHGIWALCNMSNIFIWRNLGDYWQGRAEWSPLTHTWSLGIEEQFYLIVPSLLILLCRYQRRNVFYWILFITSISFCLYFYYMKINVTATFYLLPMRLWEMSLGSLLAAFQNPFPDSRGPQKINIGNEKWGVLAWISLAVILSTTIGIANFQRFHGLGLLVADLATVGLLYSITANANSKMCGFLSLPFMVGLGKMSYSIYLWHWPLIIVGKTFAFVYGFSQTLGAFLGAIVGIFCAALIYFKVESPLRDRGQGRSKRLWIIGVGFVVALSLAYYVGFQRPVSDRVKPFDRPVTSMELYNSGKKETENSLFKTMGFYDVEFKTDYSADNTWKKNGTIHLYGRKTPEVVVFGSSHALMYSQIIDDICRENKISVAFLCMNHGNPAFFESSASYNFTSQGHNFSSIAEAAEFDAVRKECLKKWRPKVLFAIDRWKNVLTESEDTEGKKKLFDTKLKAFLEEVRPVVDHVVWVGELPNIKDGNILNLRDFADWRVRIGKGLPSLSPDENESLRKEVAKVAEETQKRESKLLILRPDLLYYNQDGSIKYYLGRKFLYTDDNHLSDEGSELARPLFLKEIIERCK